MRFAILTALFVFCAFPALAADDFGPMFSGRAMPGLESSRTGDLIAGDETARELQNIAPAAGEETSSESNGAGAALSSEFEVEGAGEEVESIEPAAGAAEGGSQDESASAPRGVTLR